MKAERDAQCRSTIWPRGQTPSQHSGRVRNTSSTRVVSTKEDGRRILPREGDSLTYAFPVWNLGPDAASHEVRVGQSPEGTTFDYIRISATPGLGTRESKFVRGGEVALHDCTEPS